MKWLVTGVLVAFCSVGCNNDGATSPTTTTDTSTTVAAASITERYTGAVPVGGNVVFTFDIGAYGTVDATLETVSGRGVPSTVQMRVGLGTVADSSCATTVTALTSASATVQVTTTLTAGTYCVVVADVGNLAGPADVTLSVAHP